MLLRLHLALLTVAVVFLSIWIFDLTVLNITAQTPTWFVALTIVLFFFLGNLMQIESSKKISLFAIILLSVLMIIYGSALIADTFFFINGDVYFVLFDDAMITMAYAKNLVDGFGLNWAKTGQPVEGYTHPLWLALMIVLHLLELPTRLNSGIIQLLSLCCLVTNLALVKWIMENHFPGTNKTRLFVWLPAVTATFFYYPLNMWALVGMETGFQATLTLIAVGLTFNITHLRKSHQLPFLSVAIALLLLLRMDMVFVAVWCSGYILIVGHKVDCSFRKVAPLLLLSSLPFLLYQFFRLSYFGDWLPNTYYLKMTGVPTVVRILRGWDTTWAVYQYILPFITLASVGFIFKGLRSQITLLLGIFLTYGFYSAYVGGDAWEWGGVEGNRFYAFVYPLLFIATNALIVALNNHKKTLLTGFLPGLNSLVLITMVLSSNTLWFSPFSSWKLNQLMIQIPPLHIPDHKPLTKKTLMINKFVKPTGVVAVGWAGIPAYFGNYRLADMHGYNDKKIAKSKSHLNFDFINYVKFTPGHTKWAAEYVVTSLRPDLYFHAADPALLTKHDYEAINGWWVKKDSLHIDHERISSKENVYRNVTGLVTQGYEGYQWKDPSTGMDFVYVPKGCFSMGGEGRKGKQWRYHEVCLDGFWMGRFEVTQAEWQSVMGENPSRFKKGPRHPVESVSRYDVQEFISRLNIQSAGKFRLPTESEWEYACRDRGMNIPFCGSLDPHEVAWHVELKEWGHHQVGGKAPNKIGIHDMSGNITEMVQDIKGPYPKHTTKNPIGPLKGQFKVIRGGSWDNTPPQIRSTMRERSSPDHKQFNLGFRLVMGSSMSRTNLQSKDDMNVPK